MDIIRDLLRDILKLHNHSVNDRERQAFYLDRRMSTCIRESNDTTDGCFNPYISRRGKGVWAYRGLTGGFLLLQKFSVAISVSPYVCFILVLILISMFLR